MSLGPGQSIKSWTADNTHLPSACQGQVGSTWATVHRTALITSGGQLAMMMMMMMMMVFERVSIHCRL